VELKTFNPKEVCSSTMRGKTILITGGTGSFGRKFAEICLREYAPKKLIIFSRDELKQHEMRQKYPDVGDSPVRYFIGDVRDQNRLHRAFTGVDIAIHTAALKQVPACEYNPFEAVQTNIIGTKNVIDAAIDCGVKKVVGISTDKAVNPVNLYGATKLCAEKLLIQGNSYSGETGTRFSCARYGNVVGSRGSVIPLFLKQKETGTLTITDDRMTRFWITREQGVRLVIGCIERMQGGEIFVPKIPSMRIVDVAEAIAPEAKKEIVGVRPGEKLHEVLLTREEARHSKEFPTHFEIEPEHPFWAERRMGRENPLPEGFEYTSSGNTWWLSSQELRVMIDGLGQASYSGW